MKWSIHKVRSNFHRLTVAHTPKTKYSRQSTKNELDEELEDYYQETEERRSDETGDMLE